MLEAPERQAPALPVAEVREARKARAQRGHELTAAPSRTPRKSAMNQKKAVAAGPPLFWRLTEQAAFRSPDQYV